MSAKKSKTKSAPTENKSLNSGYFQLILAVLAFLLYSGTLSHEYAQDDDIYTRKNTYVQQGISSFPKLFSQGSLVGFDGTNVADYRSLINDFLKRLRLGSPIKFKQMFSTARRLICSPVKFPSRLLTPVFSRVLTSFK
jgi:hypothetical protein